MIVPAAPDTYIFDPSRGQSRRSSLETGAFLCWLQTLACPATCNFWIICGCIRNFARAIAWWKQFFSDKCRDRQNMKTCRNEGGKAKRLQIVDQPGTMTNNEAQWKTCEISVWIRLAMKISWNDVENLGWIMSRRKEKLRQFENWKSWKTKKYDLLCACEGSGRDSLPKHQGRTFNFLLHFGPHPL